MSKSLGTIVDPLDAVESIRARIRCGCISSKEITFGSDGDFTWERFEDRYNVDLANNLGNLVSRIGAMADKYRGGRLAAGGRAAAGCGGGGRGARGLSRARMDAFALEAGAAAAFRVIDAANEYIAEHRAWALARDPANADRLSQVLFDVAEAIRIAAVLLLPDHAGIGRRNPAAGRRRRVRRIAATGRRRVESRRRARRSKRAQRCGPGWRPSRLRPPSAEQRVRHREHVIAEVTRGRTATGSPPPHAPAPAPARQHDRISIDDFMKVRPPRREGARGGESVRTRGSS